MSDGLVQAILVVDDDADHMLIIRTILSLLAPDAQVQACADGPTLLARLAQMPPGALVLIDRRLGRVESFEVIAEARRRRPDVAIVMLSAALSVADRARALAAGACTAVEKPASLGGWRNVLGALLAAPERVERAA